MAADPAAGKSGWVPGTAAQLGRPGRQKLKEPRGWERLLADRVRNTLTAPLVQTPDTSTRSKPQEPDGRPDYKQKSCRQALARWAYRWATLSQLQGTRRRSAGLLALRVASRVGLRAAVGRPAGVGRAAGTLAVRLGVMEGGKRVLVVRRGRRWGCRRRGSWVEAAVPPPTEKGDNSAHPKASLTHRANAGSRQAGGGAGQGRKTGGRSGAEAGG